MKSLTRTGSKITSLILVTAVMLSSLIALNLSRPASAATSLECGAAVADLWFGNDESGSVDSDEFDDALDFMYQVSDGFAYDAVTGVQAGAFAWDTTTNDIILPITENFADTDDSGLLQDANIVVDGDLKGVRELYTTKAGGGGTDLTVATQHMADVIDAGNGRRTGVLQVAIILTDASQSQLTGDSANWITAANNLRAAGEGDVGVVIVLIAEAAAAYNTGTAGPTIDSVAGADGLVVTVPTYAEAADPSEAYVNNVVSAICEKATPIVKPTVEKTSVFNDENDDGLAQVGETITYTYTVTNDGETELIDISITEQAETFTGKGALPTPVYVSGDEDVDTDGDAPDLAIASMGTVTFTSTYTFVADDMDNTSIVNQVIASATDTMGNIGSDLSDDPNDPNDVDADADGDPDDPTTTTYLPDDKDNIPAGEEDDGPNNGDGNNDGIIDSEQDDVTTAVNDVIEAYTTTEVAGDCTAINSVAFYVEPDLDETDADYDYPLGLHGFEVECTAAGDTVDVVFYWDQEYDTSTWTYRKYNASLGAYVDFSTQVTYGTALVGGETVTTVSYSVTDGGMYDGDGLANGRILDPVGPTFEVLADTGSASWASTTVGIGLLITALFTTKFSITPIKPSGK